MRSLIICLVVVAIIFISGTIFAQMCPMSKGQETTVEECGKIMSDCMGNKVVCPVMGTQFQIDKDTKSYVHDGKIYYLCCPECVDKFKAEPEKYKQKKEDTKSHSGHH